MNAQPIQLSETVDTKLTLLCQLIDTVGPQDPIYRVLEAEIQRLFDVALNKQEIGHTLQYTSMVKYD